MSQRLRVLEAAGLVRAERAGTRIIYSVGDAFEIFTARIGTWWPLKQRHSVFQDQSQKCVIEPRVGGLVYELSTRNEYLEAAKS